MNKNSRKLKIRNLVVSVSLIASLVIAGTFAFLSFTDSVQNVFHVGKVKVDLWSAYDNDTDGTIKAINASNQELAFDKSTWQYEWNTANDEVFGPGEGLSLVEEIVPGTTIQKAPWLHNSGTNKAWTFMVVSVPAASAADISTDGRTTLTDKVNGEAVRRDIDVMAVAIQEGYQKLATENATNVLFAYIGAENAAGAPGACASKFNLGTVQTGTNTLSPLFSFSHTSGGNQESGFNENGWSQMVTPFYTLGSDGLYYYNYVYVYAPTVSGTQTPTTLAAGSSTETLFDYVQLTSAIGRYNG